MGSMSSGSSVEASWAGIHRTDAAQRAELDRRLVAAGGPGLAEFEVLTAVAPNPDSGLCMFEIATATGVSRSGVTKLVDRLVERGLLRRHLPAENRRLVFAVLTPEGRTRYRELHGIARRTTEELIGSRLSERDRADLARIVGKLLVEDGSSACARR
jgi:DNA-binding MarR family transcriptional regulator